MKLIFFDFEVFLHDTLLGAIEVTENGATVTQTWDLDEIKEFYLSNKDDIWLGWNNSDYDDFILQGVVRGLTNTEIKYLSDSLIKKEKRRYLSMQLYSFDLMTHMGGFISLKHTEAISGHKISESKIDFALTRALTAEEKKMTENYNMDDLNQTHRNFFETNLKNTFELRLQMLTEFSLPMSALNITGTRVAEEVLHAKKISGIERQYVKPIIYDSLQIKNKDVIDFYLSEGFRQKKQLKTMIVDLEHKIGSGGIHGAKRLFHAKEALYFDVSGYYNLIMIICDLLPRSISKKDKELYTYMYHEQLKMKKTNPKKRAVFKTILLAVFGAMMNEFCRFYDPQHGSLVTIVGQLYIVDLLEKLEGLVSVVQSNTDGVAVIPLPGVSEEQIVEITEEWQRRTGFVLKTEHIYDIHQRDVNNYMYKTEEGVTEVRGEIFQQYMTAKEAWIIPEATARYLADNILPEDTIEKHKNNLRMFQQVCRKGSYDYVEYIQSIDGQEVSTRLSNINRTFASNDDSCSGQIIKFKNTGQRAKIANSPPSVFVFNDDINNEETIRDLQKMIDWQYYIDRTYDRIAEFFSFTKIKKLNK